MELWSGKRRVSEVYFHGQITGVTNSSYDMDFFFLLAYASTQSVQFW